MAAARGQLPRCPGSPDTEDVMELPDFEEMLSLGQDVIPMVIGGEQHDTDEVLSLYGEYLRGVTPKSRELPVLVAAYHTLYSSVTSGRPSIGEYACVSVFKLLLPKLIELCGEPEQYDSVVAPYHDNGLFANMLQVLDALLLARPRVPVLVDWRRRGPERHFQYGPAGFDLWSHMFSANKRCHSLGSRPNGPMPHEPCHQPTRVNLVFMNLHRGFFWTLPDHHLAAMRRAYASAARVLQPSFQLQAQVDRVSESWGSRAHVVGVHKRLGTPEVAACQLAQRVPGYAEFVGSARAILGAAPRGMARVVFLATDDVYAVEAFEAAFPAGGPVHLCCRENVKRTTGGVRDDGVDNEVHRAPCEVSDAEDALVDALCLMRCNDLVCIDSNLALFVALMNPEIKLHPFSKILPDDWEAVAGSPGEPVHETYKVVHDGALFVMDGPSLACKLLRLADPGLVVQTSGRVYEGWIELAEGGWLSCAQNGLLCLEPVGVCPSAGKAAPEDRPDEGQPSLKQQAAPQRGKFYSWLRSRDDTAKTAAAPPARAQPALSRGRLAAKQPAPACATRARLWARRRCRES